MNRRTQIRLGAPRGATPLTLAERVKLITGGVLLAAVLAALLVVALILGSVIAVVIGILVIVALTILVIRGAVLRARGG